MKFSSFLTVRAAELRKSLSRLSFFSDAVVKKIVTDLQSSLECEFISVFR